MTFSLHTLQTTPGARRDRMRVGRGESSGMGKTCGKGNKGQMARTGHKRKATFEGGQMRLVRRVPKRGFNHPGTSCCVVNVEELDCFDAGTEVTAALLRKAKIVRGAGPVKILGEGELTRKFIVKVQAFSASAKAKIEAVGGVCEVVS